MKTSIALLVTLPLLLHPKLSSAQWIQDGAPVSQGWGTTIDPVIVSDGAGGAIIAWNDGRIDANYDIFVQRINAAGVPQWTKDGVPICVVVGSQFVGGIVSDGAGGAIVVWGDDRTQVRDIYAQRINAAGMVQWVPNGLGVCTVAGAKNFPAIVSDGAGGAVMAWEDRRNLANYDIFAQRVNAAGVLQWGAPGIAISSVGGNQDRVSMTSDGAGGAIMTWWDNRNINYDVFVQRVNMAGVVQWAANGAPVVTLPSGQSDPKITTDGAGGAIVAWTDSRWGNSDIYAQRVGPTGTMMWTADGEGVCFDGSDQGWAVIASDGASGALIAWVDWRDFGSNGYDCYAQRMSATGTPLWLANGAPVCTAAGDQSVRTIVSDGAGGGVFAWDDQRSISDWDIYAQRVTAPGAFLWGYNGAAVCASPGGSYTPRAIADGSGGAIVTWSDSRTGQSDVFAQRMEPRYGYWGRPEPTLTAARDNPKDQGGKVILNWTASGRDALNGQLISKYTIWRAMDVVSAAPLVAAKGVTVVDEPATAPIQPGERVLWHELTPTTEYYWELVGSQSAYYNAAYSFTAPTRQDSTAGNTATQYFRIVSEAYTQFYNWPSNVVSAHSVDNLAPAAPLALVAQRVGPDVHLHWNRVHVPDLRDYSVYRKTSVGVTPVPINFLSSADDTVLTDAGAPTLALYYIVTAYDVHANQGPPSNEASVGATTGTGNAPPITALTVLQNHPNPFTGTTELSIGLPAPSDVSVEVFDVAGRKVGEVAVKQAAAGWQTVPFAARDSEGQALASGVYFYRVHANGTTVARKMVITR
jgi:FlgD Ig-like domain